MRVLLVTLQKIIKIHFCIDRGYQFRHFPKYRERWIRTTTSLKIIVSIALVNCCMYLIRAERGTRTHEEFPPQFCRLCPLPLGFTSIAIFVFISAFNLSSILFEVTNFPSVPANGESFTENVTDKVGSSICIGSSGIGFVGSHKESPTSIVSNPATATISPEPAVLISNLSIPLNPISLDTLPFIFSPSALHNKTVSP